MNKENNCVWYAIKLCKGDNCRCCDYTRKNVGIGKKILADFERRAKNEK